MEEPQSQAHKKTEQQPPPRCCPPPRRTASSDPSSARTSPTASPAPSPAAAAADDDNHDGHDDDDGGGGSGGSSARAGASPSDLVPPYWEHWTHPADRRRRHHWQQDQLRHAGCAGGNGGSTVSVDSFRPAPIRLEDHTVDGSEQGKALWARCVTVEDYVIVSGNAPGVGAYVVWNCTVETLDGGPMMIRKRYSEFDELRHNLIKTFPHCTAALPQLPPKSVISRFRPRFLERRREGLAYFLNCVLLNPEFAGSPVLKDFLFS
ncbi:Phox homologous domain-containing protein [Lineolata rhizophorae]|uniref:Endosomal/vacuolar adapter protein YPT35 n=1 Tax=Lineolata rhizophorae TaxID=578093 RepID=A0A6A6P7Q0_9PEZI|nr:Phox homologous domain-containing protein [Lineolata rhizophorae]